MWSHSRQGIRIRHITTKCTLHPGHPKPGMHTSIPSKRYLVAGRRSLATVGGRLAVVQELPQQASQCIGRHVCVRDSVLRKRNAVDIACSEVHGSEGKGSISSSLCTSRVAHSTVQPNPETLAAFLLRPPGYYRAAGHKGSSARRTVW